MENDIETILSQSEADAIRLSGMGVNGEFDPVPSRDLSLMELHAIQIQRMQREYSEELGILHAERILANHARDQWRHAAKRWCEEAGRYRLWMWMALAASACIVCWAYCQVRG